MFGPIFWKMEHGDPLILFHFLTACAINNRFWQKNWHILFDPKLSRTTLSGPGGDGACGPAEMLLRMQNQCFPWRNCPSLLLSVFPNISKERELATQFSFLCMSSTVSGSKSWSFAIIGDHALEVWQRALRMTGDTDAAKSSKIFEIFPSFFFACFLIFRIKNFLKER